MIDSFKKTIEYILCYILKYTPVVGPGVQELFNKEVRREPRSLAFISDTFKTQEMCNEVLEKDPCTLKFIPDNLKTQEIYEKTVKKDPWQLYHIPD